MRSAVGLDAAGRFCTACLFPMVARSRHPLSHARIYADVLGPCLSKLTYMSHVV